MLLRRFLRLAPTVTMPPGNGVINRQPCCYLLGTSGRMRTTKSEQRKKQKQQQQLPRHRFHHETSCQVQRRGANHAASYQCEKGGNDDATTSFAAAETGGNNWDRITATRNRHKNNNNQQQGGVTVTTAAEAHGDDANTLRAAAATTSSENNLISRVTTANLRTTQQQQNCNSTAVDFAERSKILHNTRASRRHLVGAEMTLRLITDECAIYHQPMGEDFCFAREPFWGFFWPGGQALTRFILDNAADHFAGRRVLDVGCGCGASSIAAWLAGAQHITANDIDATALQATLLNAEFNGIVGGTSIDSRSFEVDGSNWIGRSCDDYDVLLIGDLFYDVEIADILLPWLSRLVTQEGKQVFIGDPGRHGLTNTLRQNCMIQLASYELPPNVCLENNGFSHAAVWKLTGNVV
ncbi:electron transfer flavoprotein beta subunit lysine methyltransferase-like isoform X1 [Uranotaenia lowii]|uniref:electron transfer flavoprotein beta subunit lysine methyltransferase-like isoform X1 n=1 Tax=Uranotaenia lowii TaxID=190385 RepID=UPI0024791153|nr:electron transfer flavoprotein beta subunit lysine methyltransferase-like isoform X1 [Uranotaenia lowii]